jgi:hypothetical protein
MPTHQRTVRVEDDPWVPARRRAMREHRSLASVINIALRDYAAGDYDASPIKPKRRPHNGKTQKGRT